MKASISAPRLPWLASGEDFPSVEQAWGALDPAAGLLAGGGDLSVATLRKAYAQGIFPWYSEGQPILWWSPEPRMVLQVANFKLQRSLRQSLQRFLLSPNCEIRIDHDFSAVIAACAHSPRGTQGGTWILPEMQQAYCRLHEAGLAHSIETWIHGQLVGGLYCTALGHAVFGESMFSKTTDASKIALSALVALCRSQGVEMIDCQQNTPHLASLGASEMDRKRFSEKVAFEALKKPLLWHADYVEWKYLDLRLASLAITDIQILSDSTPP